MSRARNAVLASFVVATLAAAACVNRPAGPSRPVNATAPTVSGAAQTVPLTKDAETAAASFAALREIDSCALLVAAAVHAATAGTATTPRPGPEVGDCGLNATSHGAPTWTFRVSLGVSIAVVPSVFRHESIDGLAVYVRPHDTDQNCAIYRPISDEYAITLTVWNHGTAGKSTCATARAFLVAAVSTWKSLPKRAHGGHIATLAQHDPCEPARAVLDALGGLDGRINPNALYSCIVYPRRKVPSGPSIGEPITIKFTIDIDPRNVEGDAIEPITIAGIAGTQTATPDGKCTIRITHNRQVVANVGGDQLMQILNITADSCPIASLSATAIDKTLIN